MRLTQKNSTTARAVPATAKLARFARRNRSHMVLAHLPCFNDLTVDEQEQKNQRHEKDDGRHVKDALRNRVEMSQQREGPDQVDHVLRGPTLKQIQHRVETAQHQDEADHYAEHERDDLAL